MSDEKKAPEPKDPKTGPDCDAIVSGERREALEKLGRYGLYTAPALLALLVSNKALATSLAL